MLKQATVTLRVIRFPLVCLLFATISIMTTSSRMTWAFARDGGLPLSRVFAKVHPTLELPLNSLYLTTALVVIFGCIFLGSSRCVLLPSPFQCHTRSLHRVKRIQCHHICLSRRARRLLCYAYSNQLPSRSQDAGTKTIRTSWGLRMVCELGNPFQLPLALAEG